MAEKKAEQYLQSLGYRIFDRNFRSKFGEIDLVALKDETLIFVEVKARSSDRFGLPEEAVTRKKLSHISLAGEYYASIHPEHPKAQLVEAIAIEGDKIRLIRVD